MHLIDDLPSVDHVCALEPEELGLRLLPHLLMYLRSPMGGGLERQTFIQNTLPAYPPSAKIDIKRAILDAWAWLEGQGLLIQSDQYTSPTHARLLSRRAEVLAKDPSSYKTSRRLIKDDLHVSISDDVWALYHRGKFDTAVFEAMKGVEVAVREAIKASSADYGVTLVRKAFHPANGPLRDVSAPEAEREARANLFAGAIGSYKNPQSHRRVNLDDPHEAAEIIMLACHLLRIVDAAR